MAKAEIQLVHVTRVSGADVYGHSADHCAESGCNGTECYWPTLRAGSDGGCRVGDLVCDHDPDGASQAD